MHSVSIIIPIYNEEKYIVKCLDSVIANDYPKDKIEVLIYDGQSTDRSREIVAEYSRNYQYIKLRDNPKKIQVVAFNMGINESTGEIILIMNAHTSYATDYIRQCVEVLTGSDAVNVSGVQNAIGTSYFSNAVAIATTTPFGIGDARFRYSNREESVESVFPGAWRRQTLIDIGGFNEEWAINEDYELNFRLREKGGKILLSPKIHCEYHVRSNLRLLIKQYFRYGLWKVKTLVTHPDSLRWRQLAPPFFLLLILVSIILNFFNWRIGILFPLIYCISSIFASLMQSLRKGLKYLPILPVVFAVLHFSWGIGFCFGLLKFGVPRFTINSFRKAFR